MNNTIELIEKTSPTYLRRMAKEIRSAFKHGVYFHPAGMDGIRVTGVLFSNGMIHIQSHQWKGWRGATDIDSFFDGYGRRIVA